MALKKTEKITLADVQQHLALRAYQREAMDGLLMLGKTHEREVKMLLMAANIVEVMRLRPAIWKVVKAEIIKGIALTRHAPEAQDDGPVGPKPEQPAT